MLDIASGRGALSARGSRLGQMPAFDLNQIQSNSLLFLLFGNAMKCLSMI